MPQDRPPAAFFGLGSKKLTAIRSAPDRRMELLRDPGALAMHRRLKPDARTTPCNGARMISPYKIRGANRQRYIFPAEFRDTRAAANSNGRARPRRCTNTDRLRGSAIGSDGLGQCCPGTR